MDKPLHDTFISYATDDNDFASDIALGLRENGLSVWFAPFSLKVGDKLLDSIEEGLQQSRSGVLVLSKRYLAKKWTDYEMGVLVRQHIEGDKSILPIWLDVDKADVEKRHIGLSGIVAITETDRVSYVVSKLVEALSEGAPSRGVAPTYESLDFRFLQGRGEVLLRDADGPATTIFELLLYSKEEDFPFWLAGRKYSKVDLLHHTAKILVHVPELARNCVMEEGVERLWKMCREHNIDPEGLY